MICDTEPGKELEVSASSTKMPQWHWKLKHKVISVLFLFAVRAQLCFHECDEPAGAQTGTLMAQAEPKGWRSDSHHYSQPQGSRRFLCCWSHLSEPQKAHYPESCTFMLSYRPSQHQNCLTHTILINI